MADQTVKREMPYSAVLVKFRDAGDGTYQEKVMAMRPPMIRLITDDKTTHISSGASITGSIANKTGGAVGGSGGAISLAGTPSGGSLTTGTYSTGATVTGLTLSITAGSGYGYSAANARIKVTFSGGGATTQAAGYFTTGSNGVISSLTITSGGVGYTSAPAIAITGNAVTSIVIDLGADFEQYATASISYYNTQNTVDFFSAYASDDGSSVRDMLCYGMGSVNAEVYVNSIGSSGSPGRIIMLNGSRYVIVQVHASLDTLSNSRMAFVAMPS